MKSAIWRYTLRDKRNRLFERIMVGPPIDREKAMSALLMHFPRESIVSLSPKKPNTKG